MVLLGATAIVTILLQGVLFGGILSLTGVGLTLIFGVTRVINVSHGDFLMLGGVASVVLFTVYGINPFLGLAIIIPLFAAIGVGFSFLMRKPMASRTPEITLASSVLVTLGLSSLIEGLGVRVAAIFNYNLFAIPSSEFDLGTVTFAGVTLTSILLVSFAIIIAISIGMTFLVYNTSFGALMRASMTDRETALMLGADTTRVAMLTFAIGISLAALSGAIYVMVGSVDPTVGLLLTTDALTVVVLGGLGSFYGALLGGFIIGFTSSVIEVILTVLGTTGAEWVSVVPLVILIIVLVVRPTGLLRR